MIVLSHFRVEHARNSWQWCRPRVGQIIWSSGINFILTGNLIEKTTFNVNQILKLNSFLHLKLPPRPVWIKNNFGFPIKLGQLFPVKFSQSSLTINLPSEAKILPSFSPFVIIETIRQSLSEWSYFDTEY